MRKYKLIPVAVLRELLICDPVAGTLTWRVRSAESFPVTSKRSQNHTANQWNARWAGKPALLAISGKGYLSAYLFNCRLYAHRVIWAMVHGEWPQGEIDHINGIRTDNRIENLRCVTRGENAKNMRLLDRNTSGVTGVHWCKIEKRWIAQMPINKKNTRLGGFLTKEEAIAVRKAAEVKYGYHPNHGRHQ